MTPEPGAEPVVIGAGLPAWVLRAVTALACGGILLVLGGQQLAWFAPALVGVVSVAAVVLPASPAPLLVIVSAGFLVTVAGDGGLSWQVLALVPLVHLVHLSTAIAAVLPVWSRVEPSALRAPALRFLAVQAVVLALAGLAVLVPRGPGSAVVEVLALLSIAGLALGVTRMSRAN